MRILIAFSLLISTAFAGRNFEGTTSYYLDYAEGARVYLSRYWTGKDLSDWERPCNFTVSYNSGGSYGGTGYWDERNGKIYNCQINMYGSQAWMFSDVIYHEIDHVVRGDITKRKCVGIARWMDDGCANIFIRAETHEGLRKSAWLLRDHNQSPWRNIDQIDYVNDDKGTIYNVGFSMVEWLMQTRGKDKIIAFQKDKRLPSQKFKEYFGVAVSEGRVEWEKWYWSKYNKAKNFDCNIWDCVCPSHIKGYTAERDKYSTAYRADSSGNIVTEAPPPPPEFTTTPEAPIPNDSLGKSIAQPDAPSTHPGLLNPSGVPSIISQNCNRPTSRGVNPLCPIHGYNAPQEYRRPYVRPTDLDSDRGMSAAIEALRLDLTRIKQTMMQVQEEIKKESTIEYNQNDASNLNILLNAVKLQMTKIEQRLEVLEKKTPIAIDMSPLTDELKNILIRLDKLEKIKIPVQVLSADGKVLDEDSYDLGETIKLKIVPKKQ